MLCGVCGAKGFTEGGLLKMHRGSCKASLFFAQRSRIFSQSQREAITITNGGEGGTEAHFSYFPKRFPDLARPLCHPLTVLASGLKWGGGRKRTLHMLKR